MPLLLLAWGKSALGWLSRLPWQVWAGVAALVLVAGVWLHGRASGAESVRADWDAQEAVYAQQRAASALEARKVEERHRAEYRAIAQRFLEEQADAKAKTDRVIAGLRSGERRVRQRFTCPSLPGAAADSSGVAEAGPRGLQPEDAGTAIGIGAEADEVARQLNALIQAVEAGRR